MQIQPRETIPVVYLIGDTADAGTYYVRAVMRDSRSGATIATTDLTQNGRRFTGNMTAPADSTGRGRYVDITLSVYTDAAYTTYADQYPEQKYEYLVQERWSLSSQPMGGDAEFDWKRMEKLITEATAGGKDKTLPGAIAALLEMAKQTLAVVRALKNVDPVALVAAIDANHKAHSLGLFDEIHSARAAAEGIKMPEIPKVDLSALEKRMEDASAILEGLTASFSASMTAFNGRMADTENIRELLDKRFAELTKGQKEAFAALISEEIMPQIFAGFMKSLGGGASPTGKKPDYSKEAKRLLFIP